MFQKSSSRLVRFSQHFHVHFKAQFHQPAFPEQSFTHQNAALLLNVTTAVRRRLGLEPRPGDGPRIGRSRPGERSLWSGERCVVIGGATAGGCGVGPGGAFGFGLALIGISVDGRDGSPQVLPMDLGAVSLPQ